MGVRYIGGCCAFEPYHVRAMSEELYPERKKMAPITEEYGEILEFLAEPESSLLRGRGDPKHWRSMEPCTGRPHSTAFAKDLIN